LKFSLVIATKRFSKLLDSQEVTERIFVGPSKINARSDSFIKIVDAAFQWKPLTLEEKEQQQKKEEAAAAAAKTPGGLAAQSGLFLLFATRQKGRKLTHLI
jgi:hypothetical protein